MVKFSLQGSGQGTAWQCFGSISLFVFRTWQPGYLFKKVPNLAGSFWAVKISRQILNICQRFGVQTLDLNLRFFEHWNFSALRTPKTTWRSQLFANKNILALIWLSKKFKQQFLSGENELLIQKFQLGNFEIVIQSNWIWEIRLRRTSDFRKV